MADIHVNIRVNGQHFLPNLRGKDVDEKTSFPLDAVYVKSRQAGGFNKFKSFVGGWWPLISLFCVYV